MPYVQIRLFSQQAVNSAHLGEEATRLMAEIMRKKREVTVVEIVTTQSAWHANGTQVNGPAAFVDVKITRGTNSESDKARLLEEFQALLDQEAGPLAAPSYVVIHEIPATDWGYGGRSQSSRLSGQL